MKTLPATILAVCLSLSFVTAAEVDKKKASARIDQLVSAGLKKHKVEANAAIDDQTFVRRAYLDIIGRIPTIEESENFLGSTYERKREQLISDLLDSDGHVSHSYHFWADLLRINSSLGIGATPAEAAYQLWVKEAIAANKPYDEMVRELVSSTGRIWDNGAVAYYIRDRGMPLDNMSNTVRIFLGTRLECAQCHNHPFDKWTQMDYFKMAAFSYGMDSRGYGSENRTAYSEREREERKKMHENMLVKAGYEGVNFPAFNSQRNVDRYLKNPKYQAYLDRLGMTDREFRKLAALTVATQEEYTKKSDSARYALGRIYQQLRYFETAEKEKTLKLPHDYQYSDADPHDPVSADTMFGADIDLENIDEGAIRAYAEWMTSRENPTFTRVIANRLWKRVFGHGVFEPVDELTDHTFVANPELLSYLEKLMKDLDYDMRAYQEILFNTRTYQRASHNGEMVLGAPYHFQGPVFRRMTAEQIWDSIVALALPEADSYRPRLKSQVTSIERYRQMHEALEGRDPEEYIAMIDELAEAIKNNRPEQDRVRQAIYEAQEAKDDARLAELRRELRTLSSKERDAVQTIAFNHVGKKVDPDTLLASLGMAEMNMGPSMTGSDDMPAGQKVVMTRLPQVQLKRKPPEGMDKKQAQAWYTRQKTAYRNYRNLVSQMARASELESPARRGHFLREFGQSDREVIENAAYHASVPQALNLLNGTIVEALTNEYAVFGSRVHAAGDPEEKIRMIFQAMLTREPTGDEMELALGEVEAKGDRAYEGLVWALLNTQQFMFVQ